LPHYQRLTMPGITMPAILVAGVALAVVGGMYLRVRPAVSSPFKEELGYVKKHQEVFDTRIAYVDAGDAGTGRTFVFLHGNPTSSYLWRNVIPHLEPFGRCIAPDLLGMGDSSRLPTTEGETEDSRYSLANNGRYLEEFLARIGVGQNVVLVTHDWGSSLGFAWASRHEEAVAGIAHMESIMPMGGSFGGLLEDDGLPLINKLVFHTLQSFLGEPLVLKYNFNIELVLPIAIQRRLSVKEMEAYRGPYRSAGDDRQAMLAWPRQVPLNGQPEAAVAFINEYEEWLANSAAVPKLFVNVEPGSVLTGPLRDYARAVPNTQEVTVRGKHYVQEDSPHDIGRAIAEWQASI